MFLKKIKVFDNNVDTLKSNLGKQLSKSGDKIVETSDEVTPTGRLPIRYDAPTYIDQGRRLYLKDQRIRIKVNPTQEQNISESGPFSYHYCEFVIPESRNVIALHDDSKAVSSGRVTSKFNFVSDQYEKFTEGIQDIALPCIYLESDPAQTKSIMDLKFFPRTQLKARYFYDFNYILGSKYSPPANIERFRNLLFGQNFSFNVANGEKEQYPFYNRIRFNYKTGHEFKNFLKKYNFFEHFIDDYINSVKASVPFLLETNSSEGANTQQQNLTIWDVNRWLEKSDFVLNNDNKVVFEPTIKKKTNYQYFADKLAFSGVMRKFCKSKLPSIEDVINNRPAESEVLFYRIDKHVNGSIAPIQSFWIPADDDHIDYIDTQVKYGLGYEYRVNAYILIYGCNYSYANKVTKNNGRLEMIGRTSPSFQLVEVPNVYGDICRIIQPPQPVPTVKFVNEKNANNYLKVYLNLSQNSQNDPLIPINDFDMRQEELRQEYDRLEERDRFVYNNESALFEVYRTTFKPSSFSDLQDHKVTDIRNGLPSTGASLKDYVIPFRKYYYVFRSVNFHGLVSNPTPIYEVELKKDADETFLFTKTVGLLQDTVSQPTRTFIKLMQAIPATQHTVFNSATLVDSNGDPLESLRGNAINNLTLGMAEHPIWGKKFKFRITSTTTGKKVDINIKVNLIKKKTLENSK